MIRKSRRLATVLAATAFIAVPTHVAAQPADASASTQAFPPLFQGDFDQAKVFVDEMMRAGVVMPVPKDPGGGYTHEAHRRNYLAINRAGQLFRITGEQKYADYARDVLLGYAKMYPTLGQHPARSNSQYGGRLFWQVLNDAVWMVNVVQGYSEIRDQLSAADRQTIDDQVIRRAAKFLSVDQVATFDRIHNHATWATAGVGMAGYMLGDRDMVDRALLGSDKSGKAGFLKQTEELFSPDGYYTEGPYYQRYALLPFMVFADAIARNDPERRIFEYRDGILLKALTTTIQLTYDGYFFPFNDAIREKSLRTEELYQGVAIAYAQTRDPALLSIAQWQGHTVLSDSGLQVAKDLAAGKAKPFPFKSILLSDGPNGDQGAVAVLRHGAGWLDPLLIAKNTSQGMGHGHFDKLSWQFYDNGNEIVSDYGAARFLNIESKQGGRYLPENETWAKQTVAHNTLVVDQRSNFDGDAELADTIAPQQIYYSDTPGLQVSVGEITGAYTDVALRRTLIMADIPGLESPTVIDLMRATGAGEHLYDLPLHYQGHIVELGFPVQSNVAGRPVLGEANGYQHIWVDATATPAAGDGAVTWMLDGKFYTYRFATDGGVQAILAESGANDPEFNLRREPIIMLRSKRTGGTTFATLLEAHGNYDSESEQTVATRSRIKAMRHDRKDGVDVVRLTLKDGKRVAVVIAEDTAPAMRHRMKLDTNETLEWTGAAAVLPLKPEGA